MVGRTHLRLLLLLPHHLVLAAHDVQCEKFHCNPWGCYYAGHAVWGPELVALLHPRANLELCCCRNPHPVFAAGRWCRSISDSNVDAQGWGQHPPPSVNRPSGIRVITQTDRINLSPLAEDGEKQEQKDPEPAFDINQVCTEIVWWWWQSSREEECRRGSWITDQVWEEAAGWEAESSSLRPAPCSALEPGIGLGYCLWISSCCGASLSTQNMGHTLISPDHPHQPSPSAV